MASRSSAVEIFLDKIGLERYRSRLESQGYQTVFDLCLIEERDLDLLSIRDPEHRAKILEAGKNIFHLLKFTHACSDIRGTLYVDFTAIAPLF